VGLFGTTGGDGGRNGARVPDTIGAKRGKNLRDRGAKKSWFDKKSVDQRKASEKQRGNWLWN
jgi:hypothetical protein